MCRRRLATVSMLVVVILMSGLQRNAAAGESLVGQTVADFAAADAYGQKHRLADLADKRAVVLAFLGVDCPLARLYAPRLAALDDKYKGQGVAFLGIDSNAQDNVTEVKNFIRVHAVTFPILKDLNNAIADQLQVDRVPVVILLDADRVVRYQGRIDDQYGLQKTVAGFQGNYHLSVPRREDLAVALDELLAAKPVSVPQTEVSGCLIGRAKQADQASEVTFSKQIGESSTSTAWPAIGWANRALHADQL